MLKDFTLHEMRLPNAEHTVCDAQRARASKTPFSPRSPASPQLMARPWRIHELTADFRVEDVWALPTPGGRDDLPRLGAAVRYR
jgi:hypothetical protein